MALDLGQEKNRFFQMKIYICLSVIFLFFFLMFFRLFYLQIIRGHYFWVFSAEHTMKEIKIHSTRGVIYDRNGIPIAENRPSFDLALIPQHVQNIHRVKDALDKTIGLKPEIVDSKWREARNLPPFYPLVIESDIPYDHAIRIRAAKSIEGDEGAAMDSDFRGVEIISRPLRSYSQGPIAATTLGYVAEVTAKDLARFQKQEPGRYLPGDLAGASGLEKFWETSLRGKDGYQQKIVDAAGREIPVEEFSKFLTRVEAGHGHNLYLTIDARLQKFAEEKFQDKAGSLVAIDTRTGDVLAMVSLPSYDPSRLVSNVPHDYWTGLVSDPKKLFLNRSLQGTYPPGSTYKIVTAIAALEEGVLKPNETIFCPGGLFYGGRLFHCWRPGGHGGISVHRAIAESCDTFFYQLGLRLGVDRIAKYAHLFGFGHKTGLDLGNEKNGTIPTAEWKKRVFKQEWQAGESLSIAVGQGYNTITPLQGAVMAARVATGRKIQPRLMKRVEDDQGRVLKEADVKPAEELSISDQTWSAVRPAMADTVASPAGTAHGSRSHRFTMAGKTGTAQVMSFEAAAKARAGVNTRDHAWFIAFSPAENPRIAVCVLVEHGGFGSSAAAPIAKAVIEKYLELEGIIAPEEKK